jgi:signal transduction histidine kinase
MPLRRWLALAFIAVFLIPVMVTVAVAFHFQGEPEWDTIDQAAARLEADAARWHDPAWQDATREELAANGTVFVLEENGREIYRSEADPFGGADSAERLVLRIEFGGADPSRVAYLYGRPQSWPSPTERTRIVPIVAITTLLLTLGGIGWFLGRTVVRPLAATGRAARQVAAGNLDVELPSSRVREVAEVNAAFAAMSDALRDTLYRQATMEQERRLFIGAVAHDLRTPLFSMRGYLEGLAQGVADTPEKTARYVTIAQEKAAALERLVADLFDFTRLEYLDQAPQRELLDFHELLQRLIDGTQPQAVAKGVEITLESASPSCHVGGDAHLLMRAVENLLDNAIRFSPRGGRIAIACDCTQEEARFSVSDSGPGIPDADVPHLFTPLYRGETSRNRRTGGAGLGLAVARRILRAHGGDLTASNSPDGGAVFTGTMATHRTLSLSSPGAASPMPQP